MEEKRKPRSFNAKSEKTEGGRRKAEDRSQKPEDRRHEGTKARKREASSRKYTDERKPRTADRKPRTADRKPRTANRTPRTDDRPPRKPRSFDRTPHTDDRPPRKPRSFDRPPPTAHRKPRTEDRAPRKRRDVTAESEILSEIVELRRREGRSAAPKQKILSLEHEEKYGPIRLNKYISNSGICSRRDADMLIQTGAILVNGKIVTELGTKVMPTDEVRYGDRILQREKPVYLLLNKPKDYITTTEDERDRKHVLQLVKGACKERIYPVGRLDKNTTGLLLFTNDGEMTKKLTHPKHNIYKIYYVELNKNLAAADFEQIANGIELSDGEIKVDEIAYAGETKREIGITLHSGRNRIVRRIFEQLGYEVEKLDRVVFAGLTKKDLPRGKYRFLTDAEINILKMIASN
jgi:23S rRNA pseudouridine2605 synthase